MSGIELTMKCAKYTIITVILKAPTITMFNWIVVLVACGGCLYTGKCSMMFHTTWWNIVEELMITDRST